MTIMKPLCESVMSVLAISVIAVLVGIACGRRGSYHFVDLPEEHMAFYFNSFPKIAQKCQQDPFCPHKIHLERKACWGYEDDCDSGSSYSTPVCLGDHKGWVQTKRQQLDTFYVQADFGYIRERRKEMSVICEPHGKEDSAMVCSKHLQFCQGRNIMINFKNLLNRTEPLRYKMDILSDGDVGGFCKLHEQRLRDECDHISPLQSWAPELQHFRELNYRTTGGTCDVVIEKPTFVMKIDATVNMYHHFCDFFNLYTSLHVNGTHFEAFSKDVHILIWETYTYVSNFAATWEAFTKYNVWDLKAFAGKKVCFKNVVFPLLPRMIFGLFYNTPLIWGCENSGLFHSFSKHILHRLNIPKRTETDPNRIRVTLLARDTRYRRILNEQELLNALQKIPYYVVKRVVFNQKVDFKKQLTEIHHTDILIGIHGAGLTHLMFLPDWGVVFELYNCEDSACYSDLARLRGVKYITWENSSTFFPEDEGHHPNGGAHAKFTNYAFDVNEFLRLVSVATEHVKNHTMFTNSLHRHDEL